MRCEPVGEALVQLGARRLGQRVVGGVADQQVAEAEGVLAGKLARCPAGPAPSARAPFSSRRHRVVSREPAPATAPRWKSLPSTAAALEHRALRGRRAGRAVAASSAWIVGRHGDLAVAELAHAARPSPRRRAGCPRPPRRIRSLRARRRASPPSSRSISSSVSVAASGSSRIVVAFSLPPPQPGRCSSSSGPGDAEQAGSAPRARGRRRARSGRGRSARPSGCRRRRRRAAARLRPLQQLADRPGDLLGRVAAWSPSERAGDRRDGVRLEPERRPSLPAADGRPRRPAST